MEDVQYFEYELAMHELAVHRRRLTQDSISFGFVCIIFWYMGFQCKVSHHKIYMLSSSSSFLGTDNLYGVFYMDICVYAYGLQCFDGLLAILQKNGSYALCFIL